MSDSGLTANELQSAWLDALMRYQGNLFSLRQQSEMYFEAALEHDKDALIDFVLTAGQSMPSLPGMAHFVAMTSKLLAGEEMTFEEAEQLLAIAEPFHELNAKVISPQLYATCDQAIPLTGPYS